MFFRELSLKDGQFAHQSLHALGGVLGGNGLHGHDLHVQFSKYIDVQGFQDPENGPGVVGIFNENDAIRQSIGSDRSAGRQKRFHDIGRFSGVHVMHAVNDDNRPCAALVVLQRGGVCDRQAAAGTSLHRLNVIDAVSRHDGDIVDFINPGDHLEQFIFGIITLKIDADPALQGGVRNIVQLEIVAKNLISNFGDISFLEIEHDLLSLFI